MCGIFGYFDRTGQLLAAERVRAMGSALRHRGPDDQGIFFAPGVALGNQRLSVMDLAHGHQPFVSDDGNIIVVQNGEIYNHIELAEELARLGRPCRTHCDTEVLLRLYESEGISFLSKLNGMFAIAIYDSRDKSLYLIRDRIGVKPLYVHEIGDQITFASEIKSLIQAQNTTPEMDPISLHHYLTFNFVPAPRTIYSKVSHVMPGQYIKITRRSITAQRWWSLADVQPVHGRDESDWIDEFNAVLEDAVRLRLRCDVPFGAFLSGGVDSSSVVGLMSRYVRDPVKTFCVGFEDPRYDESRFALAAAKRFGAQHVSEQVDPDMLDLWPLVTYYCDQPHGDVSFLPTYRLSQLAVQHVKVVLTGDGGDELFAGYDKYQSFFCRPGVHSLSDELFQRTYLDSISLFSAAGKAAIYSTAMQRSVLNVDSFEVAKPYFLEVPQQDRINQALYVDMQLLLSGNNLVKPDRMGMAVSLEARTPFLDYRMMELAFRMPGSFKLRDGQTKYLVRKAVTPMIGHELAYRPKQMFTVPIGEWFRGSKAEYCRQHLPTRMTDNNTFDPEALYNLLREHVSGTRNYTRELRALVAFSHWRSIGNG